MQKSPIKYKPYCPGCAKRGCKLLCTRVGPFECSAAAQASVAIATEKRGRSVENRRIGGVEMNSY